MKNLKKYLFVALFVSLPLIASEAQATGAKVKPPASRAFVEIVWYQPILDFFNV